MGTQAESYSDVELMERLQRDDLEALCRLYDRYSIRALRVARVACEGRRSTARAVHFGFLVVWRRRMEYQSDRGEVADWLIDVLRTGVMSICTESEEAQSMNELTGGDLRAVEALLTRLPVHDREALADAFFGSLSPQNTVADLELGNGAVAEKRLRFGREPCLEADAPGDD